MCAGKTRALRRFARATTIGETLRGLKLVMRENVVGSGKLTIIR